MPPRLLALRRHRRTSAFNTPQALALTIPMATYVQVVCDRAVVAGDRRRSHVIDVCDRPAPLTVLTRYERNERHWDAPRARRSRNPVTALGCEADEQRVAPGPRPPLGCTRGRPLRSRHRSRGSQTAKRPYDRSDPRAPCARPTLVSSAPRVFDPFAGEGVVRRRRPERSLGRDCDGGRCAAARGQRVRAGRGDRTHQTG